MYDSSSGEIEWRRSIDWSSPRTSEGSSVTGGMAKSSLSSAFAVTIVSGTCCIQVVGRGYWRCRPWLSKDATLSRRRFSALYFRSSGQSGHWLMAITFYQITILYYPLTSRNSLDSAWYFLASVQNEICINKQCLKIASSRTLLWFCPHQNARWNASISDFVPFIILVIRVLSIFQLCVLHQPAYLSDFTVLNVQFLPQLVASLQCVLAYVRC